MSKKVMVDELLKVKNYYIQRSSGVPHTNHYVWYSVTKGIAGIDKKSALRCVGTTFEDKGEICTWISDMDHMADLGRRFEENPRLFDKMLKIWNDKNKLFLKFTDTLGKDGINDILTEYLGFKESYIAEYSPAMVVEYFMVYSDIIINKVRANVSEKNYRLLELALHPYKKTYKDDERESLLHIALEISKPSDIRRHKIQNLLKAHQQQFFWMENNYKHTEPILLRNFKERLMQLIKENSRTQLINKIKELENYETINESRKDKIITRLKLSDNDAYSLSMLPKVAWWHDRRKKSNMIGCYWINEFLKKTRIPLEEMQFSLPSEFINYLKYGIINRKELQKRVKGCIHLNSIDGDEIVLYGKEYENIRRKILSPKELSIGHINGTGASLGRVRGIARIILNPKIQQIKKGEILVTSMTRPDYLYLMKNAGAIVTDEGGVTSHAAIVSRELNIPCIVGTKIATKAIKDGMLIEVDANKGIVRIIR